MKPRTARQEAAKARRCEERDALVERLQLEGEIELANKLQDCGTKLNLTCVACGATKQAELLCRRRWCPQCAYHIAVDRVQKYRAVAGKFGWPLFATFTVKNSMDLESLPALKKNWSKFRRRKLIHQKVRSGIVGFELTNKGNGWHPHIHALLDCRWLSLHIPEPRKIDSQEEVAAKCKAAAEELQLLWSDVNDQVSSSVKIRRADENALVEVLKYSIKGSDLIECQEKIGPLIHLMTGMRMMTTFGAIRKEMKDQTAEPDTEPCRCDECLAENSFVSDRAIRTAAITSNQ